MHPHKVLLYVSMIGSALIFLFMIIAFTASSQVATPSTDFVFPKPFVISTIILLISSMSVNKILPFFKRGDLDKVKKWMGITFLLGFVFGVFQFLGWQQLREFQDTFQAPGSSAYLYVISSLHVVHIVGIMIYLLVLLLQCHKTSKDAVQQLVFETNPYQKVKYEILTDFWHFVDVLWLILFLYFFLFFK